MGQKMKKILFIFITLISSTALAARHGATEQELIEVGGSTEEIAQCLNEKFKEYNPPVPLQEKLKQIFNDQDLFTKLEESKNPKALLESQGLKVIQLRSPADTVVVEHPRLPGYVIKFMRISAPKVSKTKLRGTFRTPKISDRVVHAQEIEHIINEKKLKYIGVPHKYFYCIRDIATVIAEKIQASTRTFKNLTEQEIKEILTVVVEAEGMLDIRIRNMIITKNKIIFIDTEHAKTDNWWSIIKKYLDELKKAVNPRYHYLLDRFKKTQEKKARERHHKHK